MDIIKTIKNFWIDFKIQGTFLGGRVKSIDGTTVIYDSVSTQYDITKLIFFKHYLIVPSDVIVDVGCGRGRVFNYLLYKGFKNKMIGYEINKLVAQKAKKRLLKYDNVEIRDENIFDNFPKEGNIFYLFNPFNPSMMMDFKEVILKIKERNPVIVYYNPTCIEVFNDVHFKYELINIPIYYYNLAIIKLV